MSHHLLLYIQAPIYTHDGTVFVERQSVNGLRQWARHFDPVTVMVIGHTAPPPVGWDPCPEDLSARIRFELLPEAWSPLDFIRELPGVRARIRRGLAEARYACLATGGMIGDWGSVAVLEARRMGKPVAAACDRLESTVIRQSAQHGSLKKRLRAAVEVPLMTRYERFVFSRAHLGLLHGRETYEAFHSLPKHAENIHDIHLTKADHIAPDALALKVAAAASGPLRIVYAGRIDPMKGWRDWLAALDRLAAHGLDFTAEWLGGGQDEDAMRADVAARRLGGRVTLHGHVDDRARVRAALMEGQLLLFCHKTKESPRILIEALTAGTPIVGYRSAFPEELVQAHGGGVLTPKDDVPALADAVRALARDRKELARLIDRAALDGAPFDDASVFAHRAELLRRYL